MNYTTELVHITQVKEGDTVMHNGLISKVGREDIKRWPDGDLTLFGDLYRCGQKKVELLHIVRALPVNLDSESTK